jgi:hypothetical protein
MNIEALPKSDPEALPKSDTQPTKHPDLGTPHTAPSCTVPINKRQAGQCYRCLSLACSSSIPPGILPILSAPEEPAPRLFRGAPVRLVLARALLFLMWTGELK